MCCRPPWTAELITVGINALSHSWAGELALAPNPAYDPKTGVPSDGAADNLTDVTLLRVDPGTSYDGRPGGVLINIAGALATPPPPTLTYSSIAATRPGTVTS